MRLASLGVAAQWSIGARVLSKLCDLIALMVLSRMLAPADFGIVAVAASVVMVLESALDAPMGAVLLRPGGDRPAVLDTAFTLGALKGLILSVLLAVLAWPLATFYADARLIPVLLALSAAPLLRSLCSPRMSLFARALNFRPEFICEVTAKTAGLSVSMLVAWNCQNHWALVAMSITAPAVSCLASHLLAKYRPRFTLEAWNEFSKTVRYGSAMAGLSALGGQLDRLILGRFIPFSALGNYNNAAAIAVLPVQTLLQPFMRPAGARLVGQTEEEVRRRVYLETVGWALLLLGPVMIAIAATAEPIVRLLLGNGEWSLAVRILSVLPLVYLLDQFAVGLPALAVSLDRYRLVVYKVALDVVMRGCLLWFFIQLGSVQDAVLGLAIASVAAAVYTLICVRELLGVSIRQQLSSLYRIVLALAAAYFVLRFLPLGFLSGVATESSTSAPGHLQVWTLFTAGAWLLDGVKVLSAIVVAYVAATGTMLALWFLGGRPPGVERAIWHRLKS